MGKAAPGTGTGWVEQGCVMLSPSPGDRPQSCHRGRRVPNFNLVATHPHWGPWFPRTVCNKARAYLDCPPPLSIPGLVPVAGYHALLRPATLASPARLQGGTAADYYYCPFPPGDRLILFILSLSIVTVEPDIIFTTIYAAACVCVPFFLIAISCCS